MVCKETEILACDKSQAKSVLYGLHYKGVDYPVADGKVGPIAQRLYDNLYGMQTGTVPDTMGWTYKLGLTVK